MEKFENKTGSLKKIVVHDSKDVIDEFEIDANSTVITNAKIIEGTDKEISDKKKDLKLKEKSKAK